MRARARIDWYADEGSFVEEAADVRSDDPLDFFDLRPYAERLSEAELNTGLGEAIADRPGGDRRPSGRARGDGLLVHGRLDGQRRRREVLARLRLGDRARRAARLGHELGRRAHAGGDPLADAAAEDGVRGRGPARRAAADDHRDGASDDRRRARVVRVARRRDDRRARRADRVHRPARRAADDAREAARGLRARRAEPALRPPRRDRPARRAARAPGPAAEALRS